MKPDGSINNYKARLVVKDYRQTKGLDYFDTYAPVSWKMLYNQEIHQMNVKTAFLNGDLEEDIYME